MVVEVLHEEDRDLLYTFYNTQKEENSLEIDRFFREEYKASDYLIYKEAGVILCALRIVDVEFYFKGYALESQIIKDVIVSKNCPKQLFEEFLLECFEVFKMTKLLTFVNSKLLQNNKFDYPIVYKRYTLYRKNLYNVKGYSIEKATDSQDLLDAYVTFTRSFKSHFIKDHAYFEDLLKKVNHQSINIYATYDSQGQIMGYVIYEYQNNHNHVLEIIYQDAQALIILLNQVMGLNEYLTMDVSLKENFSKLFDDLEYSEFNSLGIMINDEELFQRLYNVNEASLKRMIRNDNVPYYLGFY